MLSFSNKNFSHFGIFFSKNIHFFSKILNEFKLNQDLFFNFSYIIRRVSSFWNFFRGWSYVLNINSNWFRLHFLPKSCSLTILLKSKNLECRRINQFFAHSSVILNLSRISVAYLKTLLDIIIHQLYPCNLLLRLV